MYSAALSPHGLLDIMVAVASAVAVAVVADPEPTPRPVGAGSGGAGDGTATGRVLGAGVGAADGSAQGLLETLSADILRASNRSMGLFCRLPMGVRLGLDSGWEEKMYTWLIALEP